MKLTYFKRSKQHLLWVYNIYRTVPIFSALYIHVHLAAGPIKAIMLMAVILRLEIVKYPRSRQPSTPFSCNRNCWPKGNCGTRYSYLLFSYSLDLSSILEHLPLPPIVLSFKVPFNPNGTSCKLSKESANIIYFQSIFKDDRRAHVFYPNTKIMKPTHSSIHNKENVI